VYITSIRMENNLMVYMTLLMTENTYTLIHE